MRGCLRRLRRAACLSLSFLKVELPNLLTAEYVFQPDQALGVDILSQVPVSMVDILALPLPHGKLRLLVKFHVVQILVLP